MTAEEYIKDYTRNCSNELSNGEYESWLTPDQALRAAEIAKEETIEKACKWLEDNLVQCWIEDFSYVQFKHHEHQEKEKVLADFIKQWRDKL